MISPRWRKVLRDLWSSKARTLLVILSISIGIAALGMVAGTYVVITRDLPSSYAMVNPAHATLFAAPFGDDMVEVIRGVPGVKDAEGDFILNVRIQVGVDRWQEARLFVFSNFNSRRINRVFLQRGTWPPGEREVLIERASVDLIGVRMGGSILVETADGRQRQLKISGITHDMNSPAGNFSGLVTGYISFDALQWLGYPRNFNEVKITVAGNASDRDHVRQVTSLVEEKIERSGRPVYSTTIPEAGKHWFQPYLAPMAAILAVLGLVILVISGFLVVNTVSALVSQQSRQIGVMKAVGARTGQILSMYLVFMLIIGGLALLIAVPVGNFMMRVAVTVLGNLINFDVWNKDMPPQVFRLQAVLSFTVPVIAALGPILKAARLTVREAISDYGISATAFGGGWIDTVVSRVQSLSRPLLLSLRNTFRRKGRLALTLLTLSLGSGIFIGVLNVRSSLTRTLDDALNYYGFDVVVFFNRAYRVEQIRQEVYNVPGVTVAETWGLSNARIIQADGTESNSIIFVAPPTSTELIHPQLLSGRWLLPDDNGALVINTDVLKEVPGLKIGDFVTMRVEGNKTRWQIVGITRSVMSGPWGYTTYPYFARTLGGYGLASSIYVATEQHDPANQARMAKLLEDHFEKAGLRVTSTGKVAELRANAMSQFSLILAFLLIMSILLTLVGGLGLTGTMSLNVLERTREIGVMRAIGASNWSVLQIVVVEGILIGLISWFLGIFLAYPLGSLLGSAVGNNLFQAPLTYTYAVKGALFWLGIMLFLAILSSLVPARNAIKMTVRDVLAYE